MEAQLFGTLQAQLAPERLCGIMSALFNEVLFFAAG
jgi:hypothetical protein